MNNSPGRYAIYLRKSRADIEAEARGEGETLARHRRALTELAVRRGYNVTMIYEEVVSGDTIASRPQMQALLSAVESGVYTGVIVNDADRLARGDSIDQGIVKQAFYSTSTLIITPYKTYDPANESDEDFFDFSLFMARFEYRKIKQRMQTGRARSAAEGNWIGTRIPFGYVRINRPDRRGYTLAPDPETAPIIQLIFKWYAYGDEEGNFMSSNAISDRLHAMGIRTQFGNEITANQVRNYLKSPVYIGQTSWAKRVKRVRSVGGVRTEIREKNDAPIICENAHPALVDTATWEQVQRMFRSHLPLPKNKMAPVRNVLSGLVHCAQCGYAMQRKAGTDGRPDIIKCTTRNCPTTGIYIPTIEAAVLEVLRSWEVRYSSPETEPAYQSPDSRNAAADALRKQIDSLNKQLEKMYDLVEQGVYTPALFLQRSGDVKGRIAEAQAQLGALQSKPNPADIIRAQLPQIRHVLESYPLTDDLQYKNQLLKSVISRIDYHKTAKCTRADNPSDHMSLDIYPYFPE